MAPTLAPLSRLIEERNARLSFLFTVLKRQDTSRLPLERVFKRVMDLDNDCYVTGAWDLFRADLDFLEEQDFVIVRDNHVFVTIHNALI